MTSSSTDKARAAAPGAGAKATRPPKAAAKKPAAKPAPAKTAKATTKKPAAKPEPAKALDDDAFKAEIAKLAAMPLTEFEACRKEQADRLGLTPTNLRSMVTKWRQSEEERKTEAARSLAMLQAAVTREGDTATMKYGSGSFCVSDKRGVFFRSIDPQTGSQREVFICRPLYVVALTRDESSESWGVLLRWTDSAGVKHEMTMPYEALQTDGADMRRALSSGGLMISPGQRARIHLLEYLQVWNPGKYARCVSRMGWHDGVYVMPGIDVPERKGELTVYQSANGGDHEFKVAGTVEEWTAAVSKLCIGNSRFVFSIAVALSGQLLEFAGDARGGFNLRGDTSAGKSTLQEVAASVWGHPEKYKSSWRNTLNGIESKALIHNDGCLILDELSECPPAVAGDAVYVLSNGSPKGRSTKTGTLRKSQGWRLVFLSSGEETLESLMRKTGLAVKAGQELRIADIEADAGAGMGTVEVLHGRESSGALTAELKDATRRLHGSAGRAWIYYLVKRHSELTDVVKGMTNAFMKSQVPAGSSGQAERVARRFGMAAAAGELATEAGLTGWPKGHATECVAKCFQNWLLNFGATGNREDRKLLAQVRAFFETHGASRFQEIGTRHGVAETIDLKVINRAGFVRRVEGGGREFIVLPEAFKRDVCAGFDAKRASKSLIEAGWLRPGSNGKASRTERLPHMGDKVRCYVFTQAMWKDSGDDI